jgi:hypothetical protein
MSLTRGRSCDAGRTQSHDGVEYLVFRVWERLS